MCVYTLPVQYLVAKCQSWYLIFLQQLIMLCTCMLSYFSSVWFFVTLWIIDCQAPLSMRFSRKEYWSRLSCPPPGDLSNPGLEPMSLISPSLVGVFLTAGATWEAHWPSYLSLDIYFKNLSSLTSLYVSIVFASFKCYRASELKSRTSFCPFIFICPGIYSFKNIKAFWILISFHSQLSKSLLDMTT